MSPKNLALIAAAVAVMAMGVYLFVQVRSTPAQAQSTPTQASTNQTSHTPAPAIERAPDTRPGPAANAVTGGAVRHVQPTPTPPVQPSGESQPSLPDESQRANPKLDSMMELANKAYDQQDFDQATAIAGKVLSKDPTNVRMLRIMVSSNCIGGDASVAQQYYSQLPKGIDREQMKTRCDRYQVVLKD